MKNYDPYGIIGNGKVARHLKHYFDFLNIDYLCWSKRSIEPDSIDLPILLNSCKTILILIPDDAIEGFINEHLALTKHHTIVHFSGCLSLPNIHSTHPLITFSDQLYDLDTYKSIPFVCEKNSLDFKDIFPKLPNTNISISSADKPLYHALCVMGGNFSTILWQKIFSDFEYKLGISKEILYPYLSQTMQNLINSSDNVLTGPLARNDQKTINKNLSALESDPFQKVYSSFLSAYKPDQGGGSKT
ncbi:MAG: DUF2520 domain-containing protein [Bacteriovoracaceae bacterium]|nr:DUF2520 domain-containing protein [Bacteriovoracaceae bacterium]